MKTASYIFCSFFLVVIGTGLIRYSLFPPYISNTYRLLDLVNQEEIENPLPSEKISPTLKNLTLPPIVPFYTNLPLVLLGLTLLGIGLILVYFFPTFLGRTHRDHLSISILNLFLGWSFLGWVIALIWAVTKDPVFLVEPPTNELTTQLKELDLLRKRGILAESEFKKLKAKLLGEYEKTGTPPRKKSKMGAPSQKNNSETVKSVCPHCARQYKIRSRLSGKMVVCRNCNKKFKL